MPHMKENDRKAALSDWERAAGMDGEVKPVVAPRGALRMMGIGVRRKSPQSNGDPGKKRRDRR